MQSIVKIHSQDNVAVALRDLADGETLVLEALTIRLSQPVARGHKFALQPITAGEAIIKYGLPIGHALVAIAPGVHIHSQNAKTNLSDLDSYQYQPEFPRCRRRLLIVKYSSIAAAAAKWGSATNCGSCRPSVASTALPGRSSSVF
ncbi:galactarate dehydratase [Serratia plymuthica]|uniref:Galactarate dehydratase n=1 Tax=Serratia plymuthica TaxID=82996 RepID=A0A2X4YAC6_SERPL|nr:galactarate dehydratase [Serratia plymuthica]